MGGRVALLFSGQGSHRADMLESFAVCPDLKKQFTHLSKRFRTSDGRPIASYWKDCHQPTTDVTQMALALYFESWILAIQHLLTPDTTMAGHSFGELAALRCAGVLSSEGFENFASLRGRILQTTAESAESEFGMLAVRTGVEELRPFLESMEETVYLANANSPKQNIFAGRRKNLQVLQKTLRSAKTVSLFLDSQYAFHSPLFHDATVQLAKELEAPCFHFETLALEKVYSNVTGQPFPSEFSEATLLMSQQVSSRVLWSQTLLNMHKNGVRIFLEISPVSTLKVFCEQTLPPEDLTCLHLSAEKWKDQLSATLKGLEKKLQNPPPPKKAPLEASVSTPAPENLEEVLINYLSSTERTLSKALSTLPAEESHILYSDFLERSEFLINKYMNLMGGNAPKAETLRPPPISNTPSSPISDTQSSPKPKSSSPSLWKGKSLSPEEHWLRQKIGEELNTAPDAFSIDTHFSTLGIDSITLMDLVRQFAEQFDLPSNTLTNLFTANSILDVLKFTQVRSFEGFRHQIPMAFHPFCNSLESFLKTPLASTFPDHVRWMKAVEYATVLFPEHGHLEQELKSGGNWERAIPLFQTNMKKIFDPSALRWTQHWQAFSSRIIEPSVKDQFKNDQFKKEQFNTRPTSLVFWKLSDQPMTQLQKTFAEHSTLWRKDRLRPKVIFECARAPLQVESFFSYARGVFEFSKALTSLAKDFEFGVVLSAQSNLDDMAFQFALGALRAWQKEHSTHELCAVSSCPPGFFESSDWKQKFPFLESAGVWDLQKGFLSENLAPSPFVKSFETRPISKTITESSKANTAPPCAEKMLATGVTRGLGKLVFLAALNAKSRNRLGNISQCIVVGSAPPKSQAVHESLQEFQKCDDNIHFEYIQCDLSNSEDVSTLLSPSLTNIVSIFHGAGVTHDEAFASKKWEQAQRVVQIKLGSLIQFLSICRRENLKSVVLLSSLSALTGAPGQWDYSGANAGLNALAETLQAEGVPFVKSFCFSVFKNTGLAAGKFANLMESLGLEALDPNLISKLVWQEFGEESKDAVVVYSPESTLRYAIDGILQSNALPANSFLQEAPQ
jgi:malonyl CoA-acyl carrier protein transacylase/acyl carrier protein